MSNADFTSSSTGVKAKLTLLVLSSLIGSAILGVAGTWAVSRVADLVSDIYNKQLATIIVVSDANVQLVNYQNTLYNVAVEADADARKELIVKLEGEEKILLGSIEKYKLAELAQSERAAIDEFEATWFAYKATVKEVIDATATGERDAAIDVMTLVAKPTYDSAAENLTRIVGINREVAKQSFLSSIDLASTIKMMQIAAAVLIAVIGLLLGRRMAADLKAINDGLEDMVAARTSALAEKTQDINAMMQNLPQGVMTIVGSGTIHPEYSKYLETIFETQEIAGRPALDFLFKGGDLGADALSSVEAGVFACLGEDRMNFDFNSHVLTSDYKIELSSGKSKWLNLTWSPICNDSDVVDKLMVCVRDVTELRKLEAEAGQQRRELEMIGQILVVSQEKFHEFVDSSRRFVSENETLLQAAADKHPDLVTQLFRNMHTIKGNARTYGLLHLTNVVHEAEQAYDQLRKNPDVDFEKQSLLDKLQEVMQSLEEYAVLNEVKLGRKGPGRRGSAEKYFMVRREQVEDMVAQIERLQLTDADTQALAGTLRNVDATLRLIGTEPLQGVLAGVFDSLPSLANELGKEAPLLAIEDNNIHIRNQISDLLRNVFMHLYRNSMDHGIETAADRIAKGKSAAGTIRLQTQLENGRLQMRLSDDGRGLAVGYIRKKAIENGLLQPDTTASDAEVAQLIFAAGFSTATAVTEISGRGVGMDAVQDFIKREGGTITLRFTDDNNGADFRSFETLISLPGAFGVLDPRATA
ncbi:MAG: MCP four helix bundle domain-containing protein [Rhodocyclaceae bacterium]|nr:MCP four helix bundle domain-containing protein [Rhodocyclaceae bacterium]